MALSDKLYTLRRQSGLSQEQLAERLGVSRQAISKWESGASMPETEKLLAISDYFRVSLDELMKGGASEPALPEPTAPGPGKPSPEKAGTEPEQEAPKYSREKRLLGLIACIGGVVCLIVFGVLSILLPEAAQQAAASSTIRIDGRGVLLILCAALTAVGAVLLLKNTSNK